MEDTEKFTEVEEAAVDVVSIAFAPSSATVSNFRCVTYDTININIDGGIQND